MGAIAVREQRLLMVRRGRGPGEGKWSIPGGRVERGETLAQAVVRELVEETGIEGTCETLTGWVERIGPGHHYVILDFSVRVFDTGDPVPGDDAAEVAWVPLGKVRSLDLVEGLGQFLEAQGVIEDRGVIAPTRTA